MNGMGTLPPSPRVQGWEWCGPRIPYPEPDIKGDTYPMTWADDDHLYASAGDPLWGETTDGLDVERFCGGPEDHRIEKVNPMNGYRGWGGDGVKPCGMICIDGILYLAFQNLLRARKPLYGLRSQHGSDAHIVYSPNHGRMWIPDIGNLKTPMFPGHRFGGPAFINFGRNNAGARDGFVYAVSADQWDNGSNLRLGRVPANEILQRESWQWVCAFEVSGDPAWTHDLDEAIPVLSLHRRMGLPEMVYLSAIQRYLLLTWRLREDFSPDEGTDLLILDAPEPWGPFSLVHSEEFWEGKAFTPYCPRLPLKWFNPDTMTGWIQFSGSWGPNGQTQGYYRSHVRPFRLTVFPARQG